MTTDKGALRMSDVARDGEPELIRGQQQGLIPQPNQYRIRTTQIPDGAYGRDWLGFFNSQFTGQRPIRGYHDGKNAIVECSPDDESNLNETVDAAIEYANERVKALKG
jgi:hypothetical protein